MMKRILSIMLLFVSSISCSSDNMLTHKTVEEVEVYPDVWVDSFTQPIATDGYDILWVIDRSGSMMSHDTNLLLGIETMMNALPIDTGWRLGIISTDGSESVNNSTFPLVPGDDIIDAADGVDALSAGWGFGGEEGFEAVYSYMTLNQYSSTWMRPSAALLVVFVSDEEEQSDWQVSEFASYLASIRSLSFVTSIVGLENGGLCGDQEGTRYLDLARALNGVEIDICSSDWSQGVEEASKEFEPIESIQLTETPSPGSIVVFLDGIPTSSADWQYDSSTNTVYFVIIPGDGVLVEVAYFID